MPTLHQALSEIFFDKDKADFEELKKFLVPLQGNWYAPTIDPAFPNATWCGFILLSTRPRLRSVQQGKILGKNVKQFFRLTFIGPQAEEIINQTLLWDERNDVQTIFARHCNAQLCYDDRNIYTKIFEQEGQNDTLVWIVDMSVMSSYALDTHQVPWVPIGDGGVINTP
jgi:hypothetical protein